MGNQKKSSKKRGRRFCEKIERAKKLVKKVYGTLQWAKALYELLEFLSNL